MRGCESQSYRYCSQARNALDCAFREKTYSLKAKIHLRTNEVRIAIFAWIFACYWNGVNSNVLSARCLGKILE